MLWLLRVTGYMVRSCKGEMLLMDFFTGIGFAADFIGLAGTFINKLKRSDSEWKEFLLWIRKLTKAVCNDYIRFINASPDHSDIHFSNENEELLYEAVSTALAYNSPLAPDMILPLETELPQGEKERLYNLLKTRLNYSFEFALRDGQNEIKHQLKLLTIHVDDALPRLNEIQRGVYEILDILKTDNSHTRSSEKPGCAHATFSSSSLSAKAAELSHADKSAPTKLLNRENELQILCDFCKNESGYFMIQAPAWFGKSALLSWYFLYPPLNTEVVGFFVTKGEALWSDGNAFEISIKEQLRNLLERCEGQGYNFASLTLLALLEYTAKTVGEAGKRLVLIIDALDEDRSAERELSYILARLPKNNVPNLVIILSCRPNPNMQDIVGLDVNHPVRHCPVHLLEQSPHAIAQKEIAAKALEEICDKGQDFIDIIALMVVAEGGLSASDLSELTGVLNFKITRLFDNQDTGRTFRIVAAENIPHFADSPKRYVFGHDEIRRQAESGFVDGNATLYLEYLRKWCANYAEINWPWNTPHYLMTDYLMLLANNQQWVNLADVLIDHDFLSHVSQVCLSCSLYFQLINETIDALSKAKNVDFLRIGLLSESRALLALRDSNIPTELPILFANIERYDEALQMTETMIEPDRLSCRSQIAVVLAKKGVINRAVELALKVIKEIPFERYPHQRSSMHEVDYTFYLSNCATALVLCGKKDEAEENFRRLVTTLSLDERFQHGKHEMTFFHSLREIVIATANAGDIEGSLREAALLSFDWQTKGFTLVHIGALQALQGDFEGALKTAAEAYITNYYNDGTYNENGRHGNEHITLECAKVLLIIDLLSQDNPSENESGNTVLDIAVLNDGEIEHFTFSDLLSQSAVQDYWDEFISKMYLEIAEAFLELGRYDDVALLIEKARMFLEKYRTEYKYSKPEENDHYLVDIIKMEVALSKFEQAHQTLQGITNKNQIVDAYTTIARAAYKSGRVEEAKNALAHAIEKSKECKNHDDDTLQIAWLMHDIEEPPDVIFSEYNVKSFIAGQCKIAEELRLAGKLILAKNMAYRAFEAISVANKGYVYSDTHHTKKNIFNPIDISKSSFELVEYDLSLVSAALSGDTEWYAKALMKVALAVVKEDKLRGLYLFRQALFVIGTYSVEIDVNRKEHTSWSGHIYEKNKPTIMDFVTMARELIGLKDMEAARSILPSYLDFAKMLWQSTNLYAYESLHIYCLLGEKAAIEKDLLTVSDKAQLGYAKAWLTVVSEEFSAVDFSEVTFSLRRDYESDTLSATYDGEHLEKFRLSVDLGFEWKVHVPVEFYQALDTLKELHNKKDTEALNKLVAELATPYDGTNHYGMQADWTAKMILLIRKLYEYGMLDRYEYIVTDFEKFLYSGRESVRDHAVWMWTDTQVLIGRAADEIIKKIRITYDKKYDGERYNPDRPNIVRALTVVLKKHPNNTEAIEMIREACGGYVRDAYSHKYEAFISAQQSLNIDLGMKEALLIAFKTKPWYEMMDLLAYFDLSALRKIAGFSFNRIGERISAQETGKGNITRQLLKMNCSIIDTLRG